MSDTPDAPVPEAPSPAEPARELSPVECAEQLKQRFPALFTGPAKPLKLRIQADIQQRAPGVFTKKALSAFLRRHTGSTSYLVAMTRAPHRFDLDGQPAGEITEEHRQVAAEELSRRRALRQEREQQDEQARRERAHLLRDAERSPLTPANFAALKGLTLEALEAQLALAREEAATRPAQPPLREGRPSHGRGPGGPGAPGRGPGGPDRERHRGRGPRPEGRREGAREGGRGPRGDRPPQPARAPAPPTQEAQGPQDVPVTPPPLKPDAGSTEGGQT